MSDESFANIRQAESRYVRAHRDPDHVPTNAGLEMHRNESPTADLER